MGSIAFDPADVIVGVDWVAVALQAPLALAGRAGNLQHHNGMTAQEPGQPEPVGAGGFHPERRHPTQPGRPGEQVGVAGRAAETNRSPSRRPSPSSATATCWSLWVSTPTMTSAGSNAMLPMLSVPSLATARLAGRRGGTGLRWDLLGSGADQVTTRPAGEHPGYAAPDRPTGQRQGTRPVIARVRPTRAALEDHRSRRVTELLP